MLKSRSKTDSGLVSNKICSQKFHLVVGAHGQVTWAKMAENRPYLWCHRRKPKT